MPFPWLGKGAVPSAMVPMRFPSIRLSVVVRRMIPSPKNSSALRVLEFAEMTLPRALAASRHQ